MSGQILQCPGCLTKLRVRSAPASGHIDCPRCGETISLTDAPAAAAPAAPAAAPPATKDSETRRPVADRPAPRPTRRSRPKQPEPVDHSSQIDKYQSPATRPAPRPKRRPPAGVMAGGGDDHDHAADNRRARRETQIFFGILLVMIGVVVAGAWVGYRWLTAGDQQQIADAGDVAPTTTPAPPSPNNNPPAAGVPSTTIPPVQSGSTPVSPPPNTPTSPPSGRSSGSFAGVPLNPPPDNGGFTPPAAAAPVPQNPPSQPPAAVAVNGSRRIRYAWRPGTEHIYRLDIRAGNDPDITTVSGTCTYNVRGNAGIAAEESEGSGTGFVVSADGLIATCAHVVEGANRIEVVLGERSWIGQVVAIDPRHDVALVRIDAAGLTPLTLGDSNAVRLSERIRVIGFPLSDVLGESVKVTTGSIAGLIDDPDRGKRLQVDAPINPGNSGGPVVDESGNVIGVASAKLAGIDVSSVGFAVPAERLVALMQSQQLPARMTPRGNALQGPEIAQRVTPGVAYLKVRGTAGGQLTSVAYHVNFMESQSFHPGRIGPGSFPSPPSHTSDSGEIKVNAFGEIHEFTGTEHLPFVLGPAGLFFIERLDAWSESSWSVEEESTLQRIQRNDSNPFGFGGRGPRFRPPSFGPRGFGPPGFGPRGFDPFGRDEPEQVVEEIPAIERVSYQTGAELNNRISITKTYEFRTTRNPAAPYMWVRGQGTVVFDIAQGMPHSLDYTATVETNDEDGNTRMPLRISWQLRDPEEVQRERELARQKAEEERQRREQDATVPNAGLVDQLLEEIRAAEGGNGASAPLQRLAAIAVVEDKRQRVLEVSRNHLPNSSGFVQRAAAEAFCHWATAEHADQLIRFLESTDGLMGGVKKKAAMKLVEFNDPKYFGSLIEAMTDFTIRGDISRALQESDESIEPLVLKKFEEVTDDAVKRELLDILRKVGTRESISFLQDVATGPNTSLRGHAQRALDAIRARL